MRQMTAALLLVGAFVVGAVLLLIAVWLDWPLFFRVWLPGLPLLAARVLVLRTPIRRSPTLDS